MLGIPKLGEWQHSWAPAFACHGLVGWPQFHDGAWNLSRCLDCCWRLDLAHKSQVAFHVGIGGRIRGRGYLHHPAPVRPGPHHISARLVRQSLISPCITCNALPTSRTTRRAPVKWSRPKLACAAKINSNSPEPADHLVRKRS